MTTLFFSQIAGEGRTRITAMKQLSICVVDVDRYFKCLWRPVMAFSNISSNDPLAGNHPNSECSIHIRWYIGHTFHYSIIVWLCQRNVVNILQPQLGWWSPFLTICNPGCHRRFTMVRLWSWCGHTFWSTWNCTNSHVGTFEHCEPLAAQTKMPNWFDVVHVMVSFLAYCLILKKQQEKQGISACSQGLANLRCCLFLSNGHCCALVVSMWRLWAGLDPRHASHLVFVVHCCRGAAFPGGAVSGLARIHLDVIHPTDGQCSSTLSIPGHLQLSWCCCGYIWKRWS